MGTITNKSLKAQRVISKRFKTSAAEFGVDLAIGFTSLFEVLDWKLDLIDGSIFALFHDGKVNPNIIDMELCVPIDAQASISSDVAIRILPSCQITLCTTHHGHIEEIEPAYERLRAYAAQNYHKLMLPIRETYLDYSSQHPVTEISWPIDLG